MPRKAKPEGFGYIYSIVCVPKSKTYVGRTRLTVGSRTARHWNDLRRKAHSNKQLQRDFDRFGRDAFEVSVLAMVPIGDLALAEVEWIVRTMSYSDMYGYNDIGWQGRLAAALKKAPSGIRRIARNSVRAATDAALSGELDTSMHDYMLPRCRSKSDYAAD